MMKFVGTIHVIEDARVNYLVVFASKQLYTHDGEYQPEYKAYQEHVEYTRYSLNQSVDHNLNTFTINAVNNFHQD